MQYKLFNSKSPPDAQLPIILLSSSLESVVFGLEPTGVNDTFCLVQVHYQDVQFDQYTNDSISDNEDNQTYKHLPKIR